MALPPIPSATPPITITRSDGTALSIPSPVVTPTTAGVSLIGSNEVVEADVLSQNFYQMLEHFASTVAPTTPIRGQIWYDTTGAGTIKVWDGVAWQSVTATSPGGANTQLQFNNNGAFGGISFTSFNGLTLTLGSNNNIKITGGAVNQVLSTDGLGNLAWVSTSGTPGGANTQLQFNDAGLFGGDSDLTFNKTTNLLTAANVLVNAASTGLSNSADATSGLVNCALSNYFVKSLNSATSITFSNVPSSGISYSCTLQVTLGASGSLSFPASVSWQNTVVPTFTASKTHLIMLVTSNGGTTWYASALTNY